MLSIIFITFRTNCKFEWFIQSLIRQTTEELRPLIQIIIVDGILDTYDENIINDRKQLFEELIDNMFEYVHISPKPTHYQGRYKLTDINYFAASNTRNTGVCFAKYNYIAFHDDLGCPSQTWLNNVIIGMNNREIYCGAYSKVNDMVVENGILISMTPYDKGIDNRLSHYNDTISLCENSHFYGSSFCMPLEDYLEINGMNEMCDGCGGEDYDFGIRLKRNGKQIFYNKEMFIYESEKEFGCDLTKTCIRKDPYKNNINLSHFLLNYSLRGPIFVNPFFLLKKYHNKIVNLLISPDEVFRKPENKLHFFTGKLISEGL
jgi:hypothetical protein